MEGPEVDAVRTSFDMNSDIFMENFSGCLTQLQIRDVQDLLNQIRLVYQYLIREVSDTETFPTNFITTSMKDSKSTEIADDHNYIAEQLWLNGKFEEALLPITQSIAYAEDGSAELAEAYSDRSYILFNLKKYKSCIRDVNRATEIANCPARLKKVLNTRMIECLMKGEDSTEDEEKEDRLGWRRSCDLESCNGSLPNTSPKLEVKFDKQERHLIAIEDIQPGEILSIDDFHVMALNSSKRYTRCSFCLLKCDTLIPCATCTLEMYCSENCRSNAFNSYHKSECKFIRFYERESNRTAYRIILAVRKFLIGTEHGKKLPNLMKKLNSRDIFVQKFDCNSRFDDYRATLQIRRINGVEDIMEYIFSAVETIIVLLRSSFFGDNDTLPDPLGPVESYAALLLINHMITLSSGDSRIIIMNPYLRLSSTIQKVNFQTELIGFGVCVLQSSLIKLSCNANTSTFIQNRQQIAFATRTIQRGEKLSINSAMYKFPRWTEENRASFVCEIAACPTTCPRIELLKNVEVSFSSPNLGTKVAELKNKWRKAIQTAKKRGTRLSNKELLELIIEHSQILFEMLTIPSYDIVLSEQLLLVFMKLLYCDHHRQCSDYVLESYVYQLMDVAAMRIYEPYQRNYVSSNQKTLNGE